MEYIRLQRLAKLGFTVNVNDVHPDKLDDFITISEKLDDLADKEAKKKRSKRG